MQENNPIIPTIKPKRGRKTKYPLNSCGKYECKTCNKSYNNKQCLFQHTRLKHSNTPITPPVLDTDGTNRVNTGISDSDDLHELLLMKGRSMDAMIDLFKLFTERVRQRTDEYASVMKSLCAEINITLGKVEYFPDKNMIIDNLYIIYY